jgi:hypothetical protein
LVLIRRSGSRNQNATSMVQPRYQRLTYLAYRPAEVLARLARGDDVDASEYTFRAATRIETTAPELEWMNKGIFVSVGGRRRGAVLYATYLVA